MEFSIVEALREAEALGCRSAVSSFWKYVSLGLLKKGKKKRGRGNALHVSHDTPQRIRLIKLFNENLGVPLGELSDFLRAYTGNSSDVLPLRPLSRAEKKIVEAEYSALKKDALRRLFESLPGLLSPQADSNHGLSEPRVFNFGEVTGDDHTNLPRQSRDIL